MPRHLIAAAFMFASGLALAGPGQAAETCPVDVEDAFDLTETQIAGIYECLSERMATGYAAQGNTVAAAYRDWAPTATRPAVAGPHGNRLLFTFANDLAAEQYLKFAEDGVQMPVGSILAKESISINKKKKEARPGPLFLMTKLAAGAAPETGDWLYEGLQPNGKPMKFKQSFCHNCHEAFEGQDALGYPLEDVRLSSE